MFVCFHILAKIVKQFCIQKKEIVVFFVLMATTNVLQSSKIGDSVKGNNYVKNNRIKINNNLPKLWT